MESIRARESINSLCDLSNGISQGRGTPGAISIMAKDPIAAQVGDDGSTCDLGRRGKTRQTSREGDEARC